MLISHRQNGKQRIKKKNQIGVKTANTGIELEFTITAVTRQVVVSKHMKANSNTASPNLRRRGARWMISSITTPITQFLAYPKVSLVQHGIPQNVPSNTHSKTL
mmetsp:Transcript_25595/g.40433  ORF Transcript_25595/g.40433 Transcript_25595/m.40433 type:complete len:104 (-) Transcript_25595:953-1264(-)